MQNYHVQYIYIYAWKIEFWLLGFIVEGIKKKNLPG